VSESLSLENTQLRWKAVRVCVCLGLLLGMLFSWKVWLSSGRTFPVLPCFGLGELPAPFDWILLLATLGLAVAAIVRAWDRWIVCGLLGLLLALALLDQMRWQPWTYQYLLCLIPMALVARREDLAGMASALDLMRLIVVAIYIWSGIHKFGIQFRRTYESDVVVALLEMTSGFVHDAILWCGYLVPWTELLIGILLIIPKARTVGVWVAIGTHAFILLMLGPLGTSTNSVIWPWNIAMAGMVVALFWKLEGWGFARLFSVKRLRAPVVAIGVIVLVMPYFSYQQKWPQYLSFHLYSGYHQRMSLIIGNARAEKLGKEYQDAMRPGAAAPGEESKTMELPIAGWSMDELNVPMPSEDRLLLRVAKEMERRFDLSVEDYFYRDYPELLKERGFDRYSPQKIRGMRKFRRFSEGLPEK